MYKKNEDIVLRNVHDSYFLIDIAAEYFKEKCTLYETNPIGAFIWNALDNCESIDTIVSGILAQLSEPVDRELIYADVSEFLKVMKEQGFVEEI